jgi:hypothetical protein
MTSRPLLDLTPDEARAEAARRAERRARGLPLTPTAEEVAAEPPTLRALIGIAPDLTGGVESVEHVRRQRARRDDEHAMQAAVVEWSERPGIRARYPELEVLYAVPNWIGARTAHQGGRLKAEGRRPGVPDLCLPVPRESGRTGYYAGLYLELKTPGGALTPTQLDWHARLRRYGHRVEVAHSVEAAKDALTAYLALPAITTHED